MIAVIVAGVEAIGIKMEIGGNDVVAKTSKSPLDAYAIIKEQMIKIWPEAFFEVDTSIDFSIFVYKSESYKAYWDSGEAGREAGDMFYFILGKGEITIVYDPLDRTSEEIAQNLKEKLEN